MLRLSGTPFEMGRAHGAAAKTANALHAIEFYGNFMDSVFQFQVESSSRWLRNRARSFIRQFVERPYIERIPNYFRETITGFSEGSGLPVELLLRAFVMPDVYSYLLARQQRMLKTLTLKPMAMGCTAFSILGDRGKGVPFLHARNLDFPGGEAWYLHPTVVEYVPKEGMRYVSVTTLGIDTAGITSMNEAGITLSLNMNYSTSSTTGATPIVAIGQDIIRRARSLKEAGEVLREFRFGAGWSFLIASQKENNAMVVEGDSNEVSYRGVKGGWLVCTNHYHDAAMAEREYWITDGRKVDTRARYDRAASLLSKNTKGIQVEDAVSILSDSFDLVWGKERAFGSTISQAHTVLSVVFEAENRRLYMATGRAPVSKSSFAEVECFSGPILRDRRLGGATDERARASYVAAYEYYFPSGDLVRSEQCLNEAVTLSPNEPLYHLMLGLILMKRSQPLQARNEFEQVIRCGETPLRELQATLYLGWANDLAGDREGALKAYEKVSADVRFKSRAKRAIHHPFQPRDARKLVLDFTLGEPILT